jgi:ligand-binding sensor domain-containing protein
LDSKRTFAVHGCVVSLAALALAAGLVACEEDVTVEAPATAPQITTTQSYAKASNGLPNNDVYALLTLSNGEFWVGTDQGIARYPSVDATVRSGLYDELNGLPSRRVRDIVEMSGKVYVATWGGGLGIYDIAGGTWTSKTTANGLRAMEITDLEPSPTENRIYVATSNQVSILNAGTGTFTSFLLATRPVVSAISVRDVASGIERWYAPRIESIEVDPTLEAPGITVSKGASVYDMTVENSGLPEPCVTSIYYDAVASEFWVALCTKGVCKVNVESSEWTVYTDANGLPSNTVYGITRANNVIWVATQNGVARQKSNGSWQGYNSGGGLAADRVRRVYSDDGQRLWIGYISAGAARLNPSSAQGGS